jgi:hypothetical protein
MSAQAVLQNDNFAGIFRHYFFHERKSRAGRVKCARGLLGKNRVLQGVFEPQFTSRLTQQGVETECARSEG